MRDVPEEGFVSKTNLERITNGIFAFTMTLLARNIVLPAESSIPESKFLLTLLTDIGPNIMNFIVAFFVLAMLWLFIYQIYRNITAVDRPFAYLIFLFLMFLVFVPFSSEIDQTYQLSSASAIFEINMLLLGSVSVVLWVYAVLSPGIINPGLNRRRKIFQAMKYSVIPVLSVFALNASLSGDLLADGIYLAAPFIFLFGFREKWWKLPPISESRAG